MDESSSLSRARQAYADQDWRTAAACFDDVPPAHLTADDLAASADVMWHLGRLEDNLRLLAAACDAFEADDRLEEAAHAALHLGHFHMTRGDEPQAMAWIGHAGRLVDEIGECAALGWFVEVTELESNLMTGDVSAALRAARRVRDLGRRLDDPELIAMGLHGEGRALVRSGAVVDGLALLDEAMVAVLDGKTALLASGTLYCHTIAVCHDVADIRRMARWVDLTEQWIAAVGPAIFVDAYCAVYRGRLHLVRGEWEEAEQVALRAAADLDASRVKLAAEAWYVVGESRRFRGDPRAADAYAKAHSRGRDPQPGRAQLQQSEGDAVGAATSLRSALVAVGADPLRRAPLCWAAVQVGIAAGQLDEAAAAASELTETASKYGTSGLQAMEADARGAVALAEGRIEAALPVLRDACQRWHELGAPNDAAGVCVRLAEAYRALGDEASASAELARADEAYEQLGVPRAESEAPDGLSRRECEVLTLVADGHSNREIAAALFISDRTVARHLTNIYNKIGAASRTQATRYAIDHGLTATQ